MKIVKINNKDNYHFIKNNYYKEIIFNEVYNRINFMRKDLISHYLISNECNKTTGHCVQNYKKFK
jgi:hypothetical protein